MSLGIEVGGAFADFPAGLRGPGQQLVAADPARDQPVAIVQGIADLEAGR